MKYLKHIILTNGRLLLIITINVLVLSCSRTPEELLLLSSKEINNLNQIKYSADYKFKSFDDNDTLVQSNQKITLINKIEDSILGYHVNLYYDNVERIYNGKYFDFVIHKDKMIYRDDISSNGGKFTLNNLNQQLIPRFFHDKSLVNSYIENGINFKSVDTTINNQDVYKISFDLPAGKEITYMSRNIYINTSTYLPVKMEEFATYLDFQNEYMSLDLVYENLKESKRELSLSDSILQSYKMEYFTMTKKDKTSLTVGQLAPYFSGFILNGSETSMSELIDNYEIIILDFWYLACAPCLKSMPELSKFYERFKDKNLLVLGVNGIDKNKEQEIKVFLEKFKISYPQIMVDSEVLKKYKIDVFPSFFVIKNGKIVASHFGVLEDATEALSNLLDLGSN